MIKNFIIVALLLALAIGGYWWYQGQSKTLGELLTGGLRLADNSDNRESTATPGNTNNAGEALTIVEEGESMLGGSSAELVYKGEKLAGTDSPLLDFTPEDYAAAKLSDKLVVLYFYANWSPAGRAELPEIEDAFDELTDDRVIGFRVNYNDNETSEAERALASELGVTSENVKIFLKNQATIGPFTAPWGKEQYLAEIDQALGN